jgi:hypothetical protein
MTTHITGISILTYRMAPSTPAFAYGPGLLSVSHGPNEYVDLRRIVATAAIYALTAIEMLSALGWVPQSLTHGFAVLVVQPPRPILRRIRKLRRLSR